MWLSQRFHFLLHGEDLLARNWRSAMGYFRCSWRSAVFLFFPSQPQITCPLSHHQACDWADKPLRLFLVSRFHILRQSLPHSPAQDLMVQWLYVLGKAEPGSSKAIVVPTAHFYYSQLWKNNLSAGLFTKIIQFSLNSINIHKKNQSIDVWLILYGFAQCISSEIRDFFFLLL